ncbi:hypothetical protein AMTRI_Chr13g88270 [Amborella trichopoda]
MPALRFKTCRPLSGNVWNRELTIIQCRILRRLRNKKRSIKRKIYPRKNLNSYIKLQTTRKLSDVIPVRLHFRETRPQARLLISHRRLRVNNGMVSITRLKVSHGDLISFQRNYARTWGEERRRSFYIEISVEKIIGKFLDHPVRMGCRLLLKSRFLQQLCSSTQEEDFERTNPFGVCLGSSFAEHNRMKRNSYHFKYLFLSKRRKEKNREIPTRIRSPIVNNGNLYSHSTYCSRSPHRLTRKRRIKRIELPTHYSEVNHKTPKAVVSYGPHIGHIHHDIRLKDPNHPLWSRNGRGQNFEEMIGGVVE